MNTSLNTHPITIVLTGATGGLGSALAKALSAQGVLLVLCGRNHIQLEQLNRALGGQHHCIAGDLTTSSGRQAVFAYCQQFNRGIDVLINNAAFVSAKTFHIKDFKNYEKHPFDLWKKSFEVNIDAPFLLCQNILGVMKKQKSGNIINISSNYGLLGPDFDTYDGEKLWTPPGYAVTKSAILNLTRYVANLYGKHGIRCNTLSPSGVSTDKLTDRFKKRYASRNAFKRMAKVSDYAGPIIFLCYLHNRCRNVC